MPAFADISEMSGLTQRQLEIAVLAACGLPNKSIARQLDLAEGTVKVHLHTIYGKLGVQNRTQLGLLMTLQAA